MNDNPLVFLEKWKDFQAQSEILRDSIKLAISNASYGESSQLDALLFRVEELCNYIKRRTPKERPYQDWSE